MHLLSKKCGLALAYGADALAAARYAWGAEDSNGCKPFVSGTGMMLNDTFV